jgi:hypothetical protein
VDVILVFGALVIGVLLLVTASLWDPVSAPVAEPKPPLHRARQVIGFATVAAGVAITFLPVSTELGGDHVACDSAWEAMFTNTDSCNGWWAWWCSSQG